MSKILRRSLSLVLAFMLLTSLSVSGVLINADADDKTGDGLAAYAMTAYNEGWSYVWGGSSYGAVDCSGLIYSYVGGGARVTEDQLYSSPESGYVSDGVPDIPGLGLWQPGHVGVYVGGGMAVDARDEISNVCYQSVSTKDWVMWFKVAGVSYGTNASVTNSDQSDTANNSDNSSKQSEKKNEEQTLSFGSTGSMVNALQERLKALGYFTDSTTEYFGSVTKSALEDFQKQAGLDVTGIYDASVKKALEASDAPAKAVPAAEEKEEQAEEITQPEESISSEPSVSSDTSERSSDESAEDMQEDEGEPEEPETNSESDAIAEDDADSEQSSANGEDDAEASDAVYTLGDESEEISDIQYILIKLGYFDYDVTGVFCDNTADAVESFRNDYELGDKRYLDEATIDAVYGVYYGTYETAAKAPLYVNASAADGTDPESTEEDTAQQGEQSVTITAASSDTQAPAAAETTNTATEEKTAEDKSAQTAENTEPAVTTAKTTSSAASSEKSSPAVSPASSGGENVVFIQTGAEDYINTTTLLAAVIISLVIIFFAGTIHYWNVSMEKRRQRARRATTVSVYRRSSF